MNCNKSNVYIFRLKQVLFITVAAFLSLASDCTQTEPNPDSVGSSNALPYSIFVFKHDNPNKAIREAEFFVEKGYPCEVYRTTDHDYITAVGGYATKEEADSILSDMPQNIFAEQADPYVGENNGFLGKIFTQTIPTPGSPVTLGDFCIPVYNTGNLSDAIEFADRLFNKGHYSEVYENAPDDFTVTIGAYVTLEDAMSKLKDALADGSAPRGAELSSREAHGKRVYPQ